MGDGIPFYAFRYKFSFLNTYDEKICGGNCLDWLNEHMNISWESFTMDSYKKNHGAFHKPRICDEKDIGKELFDQGILMICPPK